MPSSPQADQGGAPGKAGYPLWMWVSSTVREETGSRWTDREKEAPVLSCVWTPSGPRGGGVSFTGCSDVAWGGPAPRATVVH